MENNKPNMLFLVTLKGVNYLLWSRTSKTVLGCRGLLNHIEAAKEENKETEKTEKWLQEDMGVLGALQLSLDASILEAYSYCETARELWDTLQNVFGNVSNFTRVFEVKRALNSLSQGEVDFKQHFGKFRSLWAEHEMLRPVSTDPKVLLERQEHDKVFGLLLTLSPRFNDLIKHLLRADKLPTLEEVCAQLQREEGSIGLFTREEGADLLMANKGVFSQGERKIPVCDHCKKRGHTKDKCWILNPHLKPALNPHLKPAKIRDTRAHVANQTRPSSNEAQAMIPYQAVAPSSSQAQGAASHAEGTIILNKADLEALLTSFA